MEQGNYSISIVPHRCAGCYRCVRACGVGAITVRNNRASIAQDECIRCGACLKACPHGMISVRDDIGNVRRMLKTSDDVFASLDPLWAGEFPGITSFRIIEALKLLGFSDVGETMLGRMKYDQAIQEQLQRNPRLGIATTCPVAIRLIRHNYPQQADRLLPVAHPAILHARMVRRWRGTNSKVVYITPCVAAKANTAEISELDAVITFDELRRWMQQDGVVFDLIPGNDSYRFEPGEADYKPNGLLRNEAELLTYIGLPVIRELLEQMSICPIADGRKPVLLELFGCSGGCAGAPSTQDAQTSIISKTLACNYSYTNHTATTPIYKLPFVATVASYPAYAAERFQVAVSQIETALVSIGKFAERDMHNCNGCGYETCRDFATALCIERAEPEMCLSYTRLLAQKKFSTLLGRISSGVMLLDAELKVVEANRNIAQLLGSQAEQIFDSKSGLRGADLLKLVPFAHLLQQVLESGVEMVEQDVRLKGKILHVSVFTVEAHKLIGVMVSNLALQKGIQSDEMVQRTRQVIRKNLETVQQIASLLGENASRTEAILNSFVSTAIDEPRDKE